MLSLQEAQVGYLLRKLRSHMPGFIFGLSFLIDLYFLWIDLEIVIQSEVSQNEKNKYHIISFTCGIHKNSTDEHISKAEIESEM